MAFNIKRILVIVLPALFYILIALILYWFISSTMADGSGGLDAGFIIIILVLIILPIFSIIYGVIGYRRLWNWWLPAVVNATTIGGFIFIVDFEEIGSLLILTMFVFVITYITSVITDKIMTRMK